MDITRPERQLKERISTIPCRLEVRSWELGGAKVRHSGKSKLLQSANCLRFENLKFEIVI